MPSAAQAAQKKADDLRALEAQHLQKAAAHDAQSKAFKDAADQFKKDAATLSDGGEPKAGEGLTNVDSLRGKSGGVSDGKTGGASGSGNGSLTSTSGEEGVGAGANGPASAVSSNSGVPMNPGGGSDAFGGMGLPGAGHGTRTVDQVVDLDRENLAAAQNGNGGLGSGTGGVISQDFTMEGSGAAGTGFENGVGSKGEANSRGFALGGSSPGSSTPKLDLRTNHSFSGGFSTRRPASIQEELSAAPSFPSSPTRKGWRDILSKHGLMVRSVAVAATLSWLFLLMFLLLTRRKKRDSRSRAQRRRILGASSLAMAGLLGAALLIPPVSIEKPITRSLRAKPVFWYTDEAEALAMARLRGVPVMVDFGAAWCSLCNDLDKTLLEDPEVTHHLSRFVTLKMDVTDPGAETDAKLERYHVSALPTLVFLSPDGKPFASNLKGLPTKAALVRIISAGK